MASEEANPDLCAAIRLRIVRVAGFAGHGLQLVDPVAEGRQRLPDKRENGRLTIRLEDEPRVAEPGRIFAGQAHNVAFFVHSFARDDVRKDTLGLRTAHEQAFDNIAGLASGG